MILKLKNQADLKEAATYISWLNRPHIESVLVSLPWLGKAEQSRLAKTLRFLFNDCGCLWGSPAFMIAFIYNFSIKLPENSFSFTILGYTFLISGVVALLAKFLGLGWSYWRLKILIQRMIVSDISQIEKVIKRGL